MILKTSLMTQFMVLFMHLPEPTQEAYQTHTPIAGTMPEI